MERKDWIKPILITSMGGMLAGSAFGVLIIVLLWEIGPQPGGLGHRWSSPEYYSFPPYSLPLFHITKAIFYPVCIIIGQFLALKYFFYFPNKEDDEKNKDYKDVCRLLLTLGIVIIILLGVFVVFYFFNFDIGWQKNAGHINYVGLFILAVGLGIFYKRWVISKLSHITKFLK